MIPEHKLNVTLVNCSVSLLSDTGEVLASHLTHLLVSLETRPAANAYKLSMRVESAVVEGASLEHHLVPLVTANVNSGTRVQPSRIHPVGHIGNVERAKWNVRVSALLIELIGATGNNYSNFLAIDIEKNPSKSDADFGLSITMEPMEIVYHEVRLMHFN